MHEIFICIKIYRIYSMYKKWKIYLSMFVCMAFIFHAVFANGYEYGEEGYEYEEEGDDEREGGEGFGSAAAALLAVGLLLPAFRHLAPFLNIPKKKVIEVRKKYSLYHGAVMIIATLLALVHHVSSEKDILAYPALILMVWLSITGVLMKFSISPESKRYAAMVHFQRAFTIILLVSLFFHITIGED